jgi:hypothetical protein
VTTCYDNGPHYCLKFNFSLNVLDPHGTVTAVPANWEVLDMRQDPLVVTPTQVEATVPGADFYVHVEDPNGEAPPQLSLTTDEGKVLLTTEASSAGNSTSNPYAMFHVVWSEIPNTEKGKTKNLNLQSCVQDDAGSFYRCITTAVSVNFAK